VVGFRTRVESVSATKGRISMGWTWRTEDSEGAPAAVHFEMPEFSSQSDAESWLGEVWRELADAGATRATLFEDDRVVYGPMSLSAD